MTQEEFNEKLVNAILDGVITIQVDLDGDSDHDYFTDLGIKISIENNGKTLAQAKDEIFA